MLSRRIVMRYGPDFGLARFMSFGRKDRRFAGVELRPRRQGNLDPDLLQRPVRSAARDDCILQSSEARMNRFNDRHMAL
jgi:hypothetical protein